MKEKILVVEDELPILIGLVDLLSGEGFEVSSARDGAEALCKYASENPDLILLDVMMPEKSGYDVCREIRRKDDITPILMLTSKGQEVDKVAALTLGADDYIVKPFGINELLARVRAALRRTHLKPKNRDDNPISFSDIYVDPKTLKGRKCKSEFPVTLREVQLLQLFMKHDGMVIDRFTLLNEIWGLNHESTTRTLDQHIAKLRQKIEINPAHPRYIVTVHGVGYQFFSKPK
ncbi:MAG: response regulator transcription factor [Candidatus Omnitrophica bacterium]|nr:response regulator transcription factor [Candidatus Omnitrophota bacterium]